MKKEVGLIGVPLEMGADRAGIGNGPAAIRNGGLIDRLTQLGCPTRDFGDVPVPPSVRRQEDPAYLKHLSSIVQVNEKLCHIVAGVLRYGRFPLIVGGDHSLAIGTLAGVYREMPGFGVIWIDAHGDLNTDRTTPSGNIHGMSLAASLGFGHRSLTSIGLSEPKAKPEHAVLIGVRSLDPGECQLIREQGIACYTADDVRRQGMDSVAAKAIEIAGSGTRGIHLSFDLDVLDPSVAPGVSTPVPDGLAMDEAVRALQLLGESGRLLSAEFVEVNPDLDRDNRTAAAALELIAVLLGSFKDVGERPAS